MTFPGLRRPPGAFRKATFASGLPQGCGSAPPQGIVPGSKYSLPPNYVAAPETTGFPSAIAELHGSERNTGVGAQVFQCLENSKILLRLVRRLLICFQLLSRMACLHAHTAQLCQVGPKFNTLPGSDAGFQAGVLPRSPWRCHPGLNVVPSASKAGAPPTSC